MIYEVSSFARTEQKVVLSRGTCKTVDIRNNESLTEAIQSEEKTRVEVKDKTRVKTTDQILDVLKESPHLALIDVANQIGRSVSTVERAVSKLKQEGRLEYQGPKKNGVWVVREV